MNRRPDPEDALRRVTLAARGLGFVFLVYFVPALLRDVLGGELPGHGLVGALRGNPAGPWIPLAVSVATVAVSAAFVILHHRLGLGAAEPRALLALDLRWWVEWGRGFLMGAGCATAAVVPLLLAGALRVHGPGGMTSHPWAALAVFALLALESAREEMGFRGPSQRDLSNTIGALGAALFLAGSFALVHRANPDVTRPGLLGIFAAGFALAGIVRARGDLGMASGLHTGWNVFLGLVWAAPVSGHPIWCAALDVTSTNDALTGGAFGPEGGPTGIAALALLALIAWRLPARRDSSTP
ncbi:MAG: lysostaphin resistance A-like protein [bacterium]